MLGRQYMICVRIPCTLCVYESAYTIYRYMRRIHYIYTYMCRQTPISLNAYTMYVCAYAHTQILDVEADEALMLSVLSTI